MEERILELTREEQVQCLSVLEDDESGKFYVYICTKLCPEEQQQPQQQQIEVGSSQKSRNDHPDGEGDFFFENPFYKQSS